MGFTPIEVLVVLIIIGIVSVMVIGRSDIGRTDLVAQVEVIKSHIRYAQSQSMKSDRIWGIHCDDTGKSYWLFVDGDPDDAGNRRKLPGEESTIVDLTPFKLTLSAMTLSFDNRGRPCDDNSGTQPIEADLLLTLSAGGEANTTIRVTRSTGFIP
ncbi:Tfp pilus assembly protein FimT/FimU [Desulfosarcina sp.]|uniref:pilus assembly FimT family protein n=1 Tax=Desulfosarcina sp. TaxID=2027861 RepID=UPI003569AD94